MDRTARDVEDSPEHDQHVEQRVPDADSTAIVTAGESGYTALKTAKFCLSIPIVASTTSDDTRHHLALSRRFTWRTAPYTTEGAGAVISNAVQSALDANAVESGESVAVLPGMMTELNGVKPRTCSRTTSPQRLSVPAGLCWTGSSPGRSTGPRTAT